MHSDEIVGSFWVPESVKHKVFGLLKVDGDNRTTLYLYDWPIPFSSSNQELNYRFSKNNIPSIIGHLENGKSVVLRNSRNSGFHSQGLEKFTFSVEFITYDIDTECDVHNEFSYNKVDFKFTNIDSLVGKRIINRVYNSEHNRLTNIQIDNPDSTPYDLGDGTFLTITHNYRFGFDQQSTHTEDSTYIEFNFLKELEDSYILNYYLKPFMLFISYLTGDYLALYDVNLIHADSNNEPKYFPTIYGLINKPPAEIDRSPLNLRGIKQEKLGTIFNNFRSIYHSNPLIFNLIVLQTQRSSIVLEYKFITLVGALDSLVYDLIENSRYIPKADYAEKVVKPLDEYLKSIDIIENNPGLYDRVMEQIRNANTKNFKPMLEVAIDNHKTILPEQVVLKKDIMVSKICNFRADYIHFRKIRAKQDTKYYSEFSNTYRYVYCLVDAIIYSTIGISENYAKGLIETKHQLLIKYLLRNK